MRRAIWLAIVGSAAVAILASCSASTAADIPVDEFDPSAFHEVIPSDELLAVWNSAPVYSVAEDSVDVQVQFDPDLAELIDRELSIAIDLGYSDVMIELGDVTITRSEWTDTELYDPEED